MAHMFPWARSLRKNFDAIHDGFKKFGIEMPMVIELAPDAYDKFKGAMREVDDESITGVRGAKMRRHLVAYSPPGAREFFQYRGFRFVRGDGEPRQCDTQEM